MPDKNEWTEFLDTAALQGRLTQTTRVTVVGEEGILLEAWADNWKVSLQDDGKTLKLFAVGSGRSAREARDARLASELRDIPRRLAHVWKRRMS